MQLPESRFEKFKRCASLALRYLHVHKNVGATLNFNVILFQYSIVMFIWQRRDSIPRCPARNRPFSACVINISDDRRFLLTRLSFCCIYYRLRSIFKTFQLHQTVAHESNESVQTRREEWICATSCFLPVSNS